MQPRQLVLALACAAAAAASAGVRALDNGLALTPPMGFLSWQRFRCETDCATYPASCISEALYMRQADAMLAGGFVAAGYRTVNVDDCWSLRKRDATTGEMVPDPARFPSGMRALADYMHARGMQLGIYSDIGTMSCGGYPGLEGHFEQDAKTFAAWQVDSIKVDGCYANTSDYHRTYPAFGRALNATGRPIVYACSWPAYIAGHANFTLIRKHCNYWRAYGDIQDEYASLRSIVSWWDENTAQLQRTAGPGGWHDPDMLIIGDYALSPAEMHTQMALWAIYAAPLLVSADFATLDDTARAVLLNREVIAVNQDALGRQGGVVLATRLSRAARAAMPRPSGAHLAALRAKGHPVPRGAVAAAHARDAKAVAAAAAKPLAKRELVGGRADDDAAERPWHVTDSAVAAAAADADGPLRWYTRELSGGALAVAVFDAESGGSPIIVTATLDQLGWAKRAPAAVLRDLWAHEDVGVVTSAFNVTVWPHYTAMLRLTPQR